MKAVRYAKLVPKNREYRVFFNDVEADVVQASNACFASVISEGYVVVKIVCDFEVEAESVSIGPESLSIKPVVDKNVIRFTLKVPNDVVVWAKRKHQENPLFIFSNKPEEIPENSMVFKSGQIYEVGHLSVEDGSTVYIEEGAFVRGRIWSDGTKGVIIAGHGVLDGSYFKGIEHCYTMRFNGCTNVTLKDLIIINPTTWMVVMGNCKDVHIKGIREIGEVVGSDGVDLVGTSKALVEDCFVYNNDDCIVIKAFNVRRYPDLKGWNNSVENITIRNCTYLNGPSGNAIEIGHELRTDYIRNVTFENIDILSVHGHGAALSIHAGDRAIVSDIIFRDIRIEHVYEKVFDFRVMRSQFNKDEERGKIENILFEDIDINYDNSNWGYTISMFCGYDENHKVENVRFKNVKLNGKVVKDPDILDIGFRNVANITFD